MCKRKFSKVQLNSMAYLNLAPAKLGQYGGYVQQVKLEGERNLATMIIIDGVTTDLLFGIEDI